MGLCGPPGIDDGEAAEAYRGRSIESLLVMLRWRVDLRVVDPDRGGEDGVEGEAVMLLVCVPGPISTWAVAAAAGPGPRDEVPRRLVGPTGTAWLIYCSVVAGPGSMTCFGFTSGLGGVSWSGPALVKWFAALALLLRGDRVLGGWSSLTSIIKLRLAMIGETGGPSKWKSDAKLGVHSPVGLVKRMER
jgi:hypothetical protein